MSAATVGILYGHALDIGGVETHLLSLIRRSDPARFRWRVIAQASEAFAGPAREAGAEVVPWRARHAADAHALVALRRLLERTPVDLLHVHHPRALFLARLAAPRVPLVYTVHLPIQDRLRAGLEAAVVAMTRPSRIIHVSTRAHSANASDPRTTLIRNGVALGHKGDPLRARQLRAALSAGERIVVLAVARLVRQKGLDALLTAFRDVPSGARLWIAGDGPLRSTLESQARALQLGPRVSFLGTRSDVADLLQACDVFVLPSRHETTPLALLEAMAAGRACLATDVGDCSELLGGDAGQVIPPDDSAGLAAALTGLIGDAALRRRLGEAAARRALLSGDLPMAEATHALYDQALPLRAGGHQ